MVNPDSAVIAYCAPGLKEYASRLLDDSGEVYREVIESPDMVGRMDVRLETDPSWYTRPHDGSSRP
jgi:hypothetical protein